MSLTVERRGWEELRAREEANEEQVLRRLRWGGEKGRDLGELKASLDWPGEGMGIPPVLRRLVADGRAVARGGRWYLPGHAPGEEEGVTTVQERLEEYLRENPWSTQREVAEGVGLKVNSVSSALCRGRDRGLFQRDERSRWALVGTEAPEDQQALALTTVAAICVEILRGWGETVEDSAGEPLELIERIRKLSGSHIQRIESATRMTSELRGQLRLYEALFAEMARAQGVSESTPPEVVASNSKSVRSALRMAARRFLGGLR